MNAAIELLKAIRTGRVEEVRAVLEAGASAEINDGRGDPGLPLGVACFMGFPEIVRELVKRGARVNVGDNSQPTSPLSMAIRGRRDQVIKVLIELGALVPPGMETGLSEQETMLARWRGKQFGNHPSALILENTEPVVVEEIEMPRCYGTDTAVLDADMVRAAREMERKR